MTPKEYAEQLVENYKNIKINNVFIYPSDELCIKCAIIAVDKLVIQNGELLLNGLGGDYYTSKNSYLFEVKSELEKL